ncbi:ATP-binding protein [Polaromonas sp. P1(28)-8]|nr:ATP-binding protein [Polaromonas sp. P1(28)-8]
MSARRAAAQQAAAQATAAALADRPGPATGSERGQHRERLIAALRGESHDLPPGRLPLLAERFGLGALEINVLAVLWVGAFDPELRAQLASREAFSGQVTVRLVASVFAHPARVRLLSESPLLLWHMMQEHPLIDGTAALSIDAGILSWLEGEHELDRALAGRVRLLEPEYECERWAIPALASRIRQGLEQGTRWRVQLSSDDPLAAGWAAAALGAKLGLPVMRVSQTTAAVETEIAVRLHRQAFLDGCVPSMAIDDAALSHPMGVSAYPLQVIEGEGALTTLPGVHDLEWKLAPPDAQEREQLWRRLWRQSAAWPKAELADLALCHEASAGDIATAAGSAPENAAQAAQALRERTRHDLGPLVRRIDGRFEWDDLVVPAATDARLRDIAFEARERARVWADPAAARLFPYGRGLVALFAGPPGTGKTMAAQVIAADLGLDLLAVDLSAVISKWVGETAQHLQQLLSSRAAQRSVLFFDEADALYAKRVEEVRDAQDRFANVDTSHLMTALEGYSGIVLLATNLKGNIDSAFLRRIRHVVDFEKPGVEHRERIWRQVLKALFAPAQLRTIDAQLNRLARIEATGAVIKNAALSALFAARHARAAPSLKLLGDMLARELGKEGAGLSAWDLQGALEGGS